MRPGGEFSFASDFHDYALDVAEAVETVPGWRCSLSPSCTENLPGYPLSKYMRRFLDKGEPIFHVQARREIGILPAQVKAPKLRPGFRIPLGAASP
jgi:tRNA (guanine-N7-)-methyltransferase